MRVRLELGSDAQVTATLTRGGKQLARVSRPLGQGARALDLPLGAGAAKGPARLEVVVSGGDGVSLTLRDTVRVPARRH